MKSRGESRDGSPVERQGFALRREIRDLLRPFLVEGGFAPDAFEEALARLARHRDLAMRQILLFYREERIADEMAALEVLGRLARPEDDDFLLRVADDPAEPESARVAAALVLLGHNAAQRLRSEDISRLVLRWQARFLAEEPSLCPPLARLYMAAPKDERAAWVALQERELTEPEGRAAVLEMLLRVEDEPDLRRLLLDAIGRYPHPTARAALRRIESRTPEERDRITGSLADLAAEAEPDLVPEGWSARVGFCDGTGSFPLRFDFRLPGRRPRSAVFILNLDTGVREALALTGLEVERYDRLQPAADQSDDAESDSLMVDVAVPLALGMLVSAERADQREGRVAPSDFAHARRLLDPLADLRPLVPEPPASLEPASSISGSARLLDHPGYGGWFYDAGDHALDDFRIEVLRRCKPGRSPDDALVSRAAERLARSGEPRRLGRMLRHNAMVHLAAGERDEAAVAVAIIEDIVRGAFARVPLVRRMVRESLHPGHFYLSPVSDVPERHDLAALLLPPGRTRRRDILRLDLAWILMRAFEVWLSRVPCEQRPHSDQVQAAVEGVSEAAADGISLFVAELGAGGGAAFQGEGFGEFAPRLAERLHEALERSHLRAPAWDAELRWLVELLVAASESLIFKVCFASCPGRCLFEPDALGEELLRPGRFPAGRDAEIELRTWPGIYVNQPAPGYADALARFVSGCGTAFSERVQGRRPAKQKEPFECSLCGEVRPATTRARGRLVTHEGANDPQPVCRRCQRRYRRDAEYRAEIKATLGRLVYS